MWCGDKQAVELKLLLAEVTQSGKHNTSILNFLLPYSGFVTQGL